MTQKQKAGELVSNSLSSVMGRDTTISTNACLTSFRDTHPSSYCMRFFYFFCLSSDPKFLSTIYVDLQLPDTWKSPCFCNPVTYLSKNSTLVQALEIPTVDDYSFMKSYGFVTYNIFYFLLLLLLFEQITLRKLNMLGSLNASI